MIETACDMHSCDWITVASPTRSFRALCRSCDIGKCGWMCGRVPQLRSFLTQIMNGLALDAILSRCLHAPAAVETELLATI